MGTNATSARYFSAAEPYLRGNHRIELRREIVRELLGSPQGKRILDIGCGNGEISLQFAATNKVTLVDNSPAMLDAAQANARRIGASDCDFVLGDVVGLEAPPFDIVIAVGLLAHVDDLSSAMAAIAGNVRSGGSLILQFSDGAKLVNRIGHVLLRARGRRYKSMTRNDVLIEARANGLVLSDERNHLLIVPGMHRLIGAGLLPYDRFVRRHPRLAHHGAETIALMTKC